MNAGAIITSICFFILFLEAAYATFVFDIEKKGAHSKIARTKWDDYCERILQIPLDAYAKFAPIDQIQDIAKKLEQVVITGDKKQQKLARQHLDNLKVIPMMFILINVLPVVGIVFMLLMIYLILHSLTGGTRIDLTFIFMISTMLVTYLFTYITLRKFAHWSIARKLRKANAIIVTNAK